MEKVSADALRSAAPNWSLGGDKQLLDILQNIHQKIMTKCTETNAKLEELVDSLDTASVDLQNVNNKFMALSNSQFVECRVYDDDIDLVNEVAVPKEQPKQAENKPEIPNIKESLLVIESMHEQVQILDSDTSDDEDEGRIILKPKDMYHQRPLPYIIGSQMWKKKWHAGLVVEDSDTDSTGSKPAPREEYSDSEPEVTDTQTDKQHDITISSSNTSVEVSTSIPQKPVRPADVAAELARRLGGDAIPPPPTIPEDLPPPTGKVYRPEQPTRATIFSNEPPPLEQYESSSEDDIFAELHKKPYPHSNRVENRANVVDELFGKSPEFLDKISNTMDKRPVFEDESEPELFAEKPKPKTPEPKEDGFKKPVGGISLFGSNKDSNSIGAAILKRNQRKSSSEEEEIPETQPAPKPNKNIIEDLFVKPKTNKVNKQINKEVKKDKEINTEQKIEQKKVDLFSDDLFDDIDDIFTSKVVTKKVDKKSDVKEKSKEKSIFDSDDELFSDIKVKENVTESKVSAANNIGQKNKVVFDANDDNLFSEESPTKANKTEKESNLISNTNKAKSIFDDDTDDELFKNDDIKSSNLKNNVIKESAIKTNTKKNSIFDDSDDELFSEPKSKSNIEIAKTAQLFKEESIKEQKKEDIFNDKLCFESENKTESEDLVNKPSRNNTIASEIKKKRSSLFDDDSEEELFSGKNSSQKEIDKSVHTANSNKDFEIGENKKQDENICDKNTLEIPTETVKYDLNETNIPEKQEIIDIIDEKTVELDKNQNTPLDSKNDKLSIIKNKQQFQSPSLFDDDEMDDLFSNNKKHANKTSDAETSNHSKIEIENSIPIESKDAQNVDNEVIVNTITQEQNIFDKTPQPPIPDISSHEIEDNILEEPPEWTSEVKESDIMKPITEKHEILNETTEEERKNESTLLDSKIDIVTESIIENEAEKPKPNTENTAKPKEPSIFSDIFNDMPPEFEKPKEPKKSKNVNALFDDDSDDETFFKKSDVINEDLPSPSYDTNERFSIFHDEPPAIDADFVPKPVITTKTIDIEDDFDIYDKNNLQQDSNTKDNKIDVISNRVSEEIKSESILKTSKNEDDQRNENLATLEDSIRSTNAMITEKINKMQSDIQKTDDTEAKLNKNIGKLKPVNFNINVNTLLPGASPKKTKPIEDVDGVMSSKIPETTEQNTKETSEKVKEVKTVNFEDEKDSEILNNKISKERAKIQVKRRPSTRRARKEAARKSGIDFGDTIDSPDNSSSIEEPAKSLHKVDKKDSNIDTDNINNSTETKTENVDNNINDIANESSNVRNNNEEVTSHNTDSKLRSSNKNVTSKVVYILNDEDIFSDVNKNPEHKANSIEPSSSTDKKLDDNHNPNTDKKASIFDLSDSDSELFGAKKVTVTPKAKLFESDSDDDLFGGNSKKDRKIVKEEIKPKGSLFGDESDDDIFSTKTKKKDEKLPSRETTNTASEPVFEDPLSMLTQEDD